MENKKPKLDNDNTLFPTVGEQAEGVEYVNSNDLKTTSAEDAQGRPVQEIESLCMNCHEQGTTKLLMTYIPNFREVVVMSFHCDHCGFRNSEIQSAAEIQELGTQFDVTLTKKEELGIAVVKSEYASCKFEDLDIEIPKGPGRITTIDGLLLGMRDDLERDQPVRKHVDLDTYTKIAELNEKLTQCAEGNVLPLKFTLVDPSGNSFVELDKVANGSLKTFKRTPTQIRQMGLTVPPELDQRNASVSKSLFDHGGEFSDMPLELRDEVQTFNGVCPSCQNEVPTNMKVVNIPHFKDVIVMSSVCHQCGFKSNEVKTGGSVPTKGRRVALELVEPEDLSRDILKSETCTIKIPDLSLELVQGTLGGKFTTIEGLLNDVYDQLEKRVLETNKDELSKDEERRWAAFLARLQSAIDGQLFPFTLYMEDPLAASYIQNVYAPDEDPNMKVEDYERTFEENEELGLNDMKTD